MWLTEKCLHIYTHFRMQSFNAVFVRIQDGAVCAYGGTKPFDKSFVFWLPLGGVPVSPWESRLVGVSKLFACCCWIYPQFLVRQRIRKELLDITGCSPLRQGNACMVPRLAPLHTRPVEKGSPHTHSLTPVTHTHTPLGHTHSHTHPEVFLRFAFREGLKMNQLPCSLFPGDFVEYT